jgi:hypothetical protein
MAAKLDKAAEIDPAVGRRSAERFSPDRVAARYGAVYYGHDRRRLEGSRCHSSRLAQLTRR